MAPSLPVNALTILTQIIQSAARASSLESQINLIVDQISEQLAVDVCSLYRRLDDDSLSLVATHGLSRSIPVVIPPGSGLVGKVMLGQHTINISEPSQHPDYFYVAHSHEEEFHSFCGVPLIYRGVVNGVLVVQSRRPDCLSSEQEALLSTLAVHLAHLMISLASGPLRTRNENIVYAGIRGAQGLALGRAIVQLHPNLAKVQRLQSESSVRELEGWHHMKQAAIEEMCRERVIVLKEMGDGPASVLDAYQMMLQDPLFEQLIEAEIKAGFQLPWALKKAVESISEQFRVMEDPYLRARAEDIEHLGDKLYQIWKGDGEQSLPESEGPLILVGDRISVSVIAKLATRDLVGIVCFEGAALSHIAVFANALGIPAVMGVEGLSVSNGDPLIVDGTRGEVICAPSQVMQNEYQRMIRERELLDVRLQQDIHLPAETIDHQRVTLMANSGLQADVEPGLRFGAEGVGLYRTEVPFMLSESLPSEQEQESIYQNVLRQYRGKPVYLRSLDIGSDKSLPYLPGIHEDNPALGLRGIRYSLDNISLLTTQVKAALKAAGDSDQLHLLFPMIGSTEQLDESIALVKSTFEELTEQGFTLRYPKIGMMVEVPSCISLLPFWRSKLDFISVGSNDLSQYLLAIDRNNPLVSKWFDPLHPAVLFELKRIVDFAKAEDLPVSLCGEMASDPVAVIFLLALGFRQLSMSAAKIPLIKSLIRHIDLGDLVQLLTEALRLDTAASIRHLGEQFIASLDMPCKELLAEIKRP